ncbi:MAG: TonB-dependent receptor [Flavobacteriaceae bacterium]|nr:TonB-dependent receptor [Flavobacteriaceae bacterium]
MCKNIIIYMRSIRTSVLFSFLVLAVGTTLSVEAQEKEDDLDTEVVNIVKPYTPTISDAFKVKETPTLNDSISTQKKEVKYSIFSVPVASTFTPAKGKAATVEKAKPIKLYDNYATAGLGNYQNYLAEFYSNFQLSRTDNAGFFFRHNSSRGGIDEVRTDNKYLDTQLDANYSSNQKDITYRIEAGGEHQYFNWYGLNDHFNELPAIVLDEVDLWQTYFGGYLGGSISLEDSFFEEAALRFRYAGDAYSTSEIRANLQSEFAFRVQDFDFELDAEVDYLNGSFKQGLYTKNDSEYGFLNVGIKPSIAIVRDDWTVDLGVGAYLSLDQKASSSSFYIYPQVSASYRVVDELLIAYGGLEGGLKQNTYYDFKEQNPFVSPTLTLMPTSQLYDAYVGLKGKLSNSIGYNIRGSFARENDKALFKSNAYDITETVIQDFEFGNSFQVVYDDVNVLNFFAELKVEASDVFTLGISAEYFSYITDLEEEAWNLPELKATLFSNFNITEKIYGGASLFYVGERKDQEFEYGGIVVNEPMEITLDGYLDANLHLGYRVNEQLSIFAKGSNLLGDNYERWNNYPVLGIQGMLGATYKFDW